MAREIVLSELRKNLLGKLAGADNQPSVSTSGAVETVADLSVRAREQNT